MASALQSKKQCYTERSSLRYREITAQSIQRMQILHRGIFMPAFDRILQLARMEEMDCEFVEVTAHEGARPTHAVWQGRVYHRGGAVVQDAFRIGHRAGTAVLPPCSTPQQLTEHQNKNTLFRVAAHEKGCFVWILPWCEEESCYSGKRLRPHFP